ncbi:hypothetical protein CaCOL14_008579 [Colletotrichum acutatum]|uniref:Uncharacterized protein n=1 Tax=Glomerella acutata TaxID=27357 RepID=A0AAD8XKC0_GLOAC|nr:uncharacterized protein BDZ83DRAFT_789315 [Colletotrichum acutatum]KAK1728956.1 hypothetical protein BDZ83DRAFT_789315 [Colletotrichum acutatum]
MQFSTSLIALAATVFFGAHGAPTGNAHRDNDVVGTGTPNLVKYVGASDKDKAFIPEGAGVINTDKVVPQQYRPKAKPVIPITKEGDGKVDTNVPITKDGDDKTNAGIPTIKEGDGKVNNTDIATPEAPDSSVDDFIQHGGALCQHQQLKRRVLHAYSLKAYSGVDDAPKVCGDLWHNLRRFPGCAAASDASCRAGTDKGELIWHFVASTFCNAGMVQSAWYEATHNDYGAAECKDVEQLGFR